MRRLLMLALCLVGCASANIGGNPGDDGDDDQPDAPGPPPIDAPDIDAPVAVELNQNGANNVVATQIACQQVDPLTNFTTENSYYRTFPLAEANITVPFNITSVTFAVERATPGGGGASIPAELRLGKFTGTLNAATFPLTVLQQLAVAPIQIPANATSVTTPIAQFNPGNLTLDPADILYAELFIPDGRPAGHIFYIGSNAGTETHPSYIRAQDCDVNTPTSYATAVGSPAIRILLTVSGTR
jgi:hypothetical protein